MGWNLIIQYLILTVFICVIVILLVYLVLIKGLEKIMRRKMEKEADKAIRQEIASTMETEIIDYASSISMNVLSAKMGEHVNQFLIAEFMEKLKQMDISSLAPDIRIVYLISATVIPEAFLTEIVQVLKLKFSRDITVMPQINADLIAGVVLDFKHFKLDYSLQAAFKESAQALKQKIAKR